MDCTKTAGQILESSERQCRICSLSLLRFWHIALIVILVILREKESWAHWIWWRYWLEWEKEDAWKLERKPLGITLEWRQRPMKWMWLQNLVFAKTRTAKRNASSLLIGGKGKKVIYNFLPWLKCKCLFQDIPYYLWREVLLPVETLYLVVIVFFCNDSN